MKIFLEIFATCLVGCYVLIAFIAPFLIESFWGGFLFAALVVALVINAFFRQTCRIEELEKRLDALEEGKKAP